MLKGDKVVFRKAFGSRSLTPTKTPMKADLLFDMASCTKTVATTTSIMILRDEGKLKLSDPVAKYWPEFGENGKEKITIADLLLHVSGLIADNNIKDYADGIPKSWERIAAMKPKTEPGKAMVYSDMNFITLGELVRRISGKPLDVFARERIFEPLGMKDSGFRPLAEPNPKPAERITPTAKRHSEDKESILGEVHDPRSYALGGVAGHAGLFSTVDDLARFARMILHDGELDGKRILSAESVRLIETSPEGPASGRRTYGWQLVAREPTSPPTAPANVRSFGHTGFTGQKIWIDPGSKSAVIVLTNALHPNKGGARDGVRTPVVNLLGKALVEADAPAKAGDAAAAKKSAP